MDASWLYKNCRLCPRMCGVDRLAGPDGYCRESSQLRIAFAGLHSGEEPPLSGMNGSGTIFISGCNLGCALCQNWQISSSAARPHRTDGHLGRVVSVDEFSAICLELEKNSAQNINIVTGSHAIPGIVLGINAAKAAGLSIPVLWNSSGYESIEALELLKDVVDTYLPDLKTLDSALAAAFFNAADYPEIAAQAVLWMIKTRECEPADFDRPGVIIRHLILPGYLESTRSVLRWFAENANSKAQLSLMTQYTPIPGTNGPGRFLCEREYETILGWLGEFCIEDGFCQELVTGNDWLPDFRRRNPFSSKLSVTLWHYGKL